MRSAGWSRANFELAADQPGAVAHDPQTDPVVRRTVVGESFAIVVHFQHEPAVARFEADAKAQHA
jgi:hypothetical protein